MKPVAFSHCIAAFCNQCQEQYDVLRPGTLFTTHTQRVNKLWKDSWTEKCLNVLSAASADVIPAPGPSSLKCQVNL